ncbi:PIH1 domain-containing protein 2 isoform X1 [Gasterosteus aculeatus]|uniref:PIH1 domain-containing protein 2 isoform X1 n=1 Tax=Gasterosteus aculeatus aculeatus TaxID=481459 RepID=UPI001A9A0B91|nr:PIH1 domain-containing protein 2 isoform X1 [Gasterosteus aculeatus aculeatus]
MSSTGSTPDVFQQVNQFWSILDDLSQSDPAAYDEFIKKQMKEGAEFCSPPELDSCLCTEILEPKKGSLFINICRWKRVPAPRDPSMALPACAGKLETDTDERQGWYSVLDVALNPAVLQESKKDKREVHTLAVGFARQQHGMSLSQHYTVVNCSPKSSPEDVRRRLGYEQWSNTSSQPDIATQDPSALLQQISSLRSENQHKEPAGQIISRPAEHKKTNLIQVISTTFVQPEKPKYQLEVKTNIVGSAHSMELTVDLPKVRSMSECQLRISKDDVLLEVEDVYHLLLEFPKTVIEDTATAIFNKKTRRLTLKVDVVLTN